MVQTGQGTPLSSAGQRAEAWAMKNRDAKNARVIEVKPVCLPEDGHARARDAVDPHTASRRAEKQKAWLRESGLEALQAGGLLPVGPVSGGELE